MYYEQIGGFILGKDDDKVIKGDPDRIIQRPSDNYQYSHNFERLILRCDRRYDRLMPEMLKAHIARTDQHIIVLYDFFVTLLGDSNLPLNPDRSEVNSKPSEVISNPDYWIYLVSLNPASLEIARAASKTHDLGCILSMIDHPRLSLDIAFPLSVEVGYHPERDRVFFKELADAIINHCGGNPTSMAARFMAEGDSSDRFIDSPELEKRLHYWMTPAALTCYNEADRLGELAATDYNPPSEPVGFEEYCGALAEKYGKDPPKLAEKIAGFLKDHYTNLGKTPIGMFIKAMTIGYAERVADRLLGNFGYSLSQVYERPKKK
ncbi:hypothetical protein ACFL0W_05920 [Nanoarchaeota archaeon]